MRFFEKSLLFMGLCLAPALLSAQTAPSPRVVDKEELKLHPIDQSTANCLKELHTPSEKIACEVEALRLWDAELNKQYKLLMAALPEAEKANLRNAQRQWILYRDKDLLLSEGLYSNKKTSYWQLEKASRATQLTKTRALELERYLAHFNE